jgi:hypothetical protein
MWFFLLIAIIYAKEFPGGFIGEKSGPVKVIEWDDNCEFSKIKVCFAYKVWFTKLELSSDKCGIKTVQTNSFE